MFWFDIQWIEREYTVCLTYKEFLAMQKQMDEQDYYKSKVLILSIEYDVNKFQAKVIDKIRK